MHYNTILVKYVHLIYFLSVDHILCQQLLFTYRRVNFEITEKGVENRAFESFHSDDEIVEAKRIHFIDFNN